MADRRKPPSTRAARRRSKPSALTQSSRALAVLRLSAVLLLVAGFSSSALAADMFLTFRCEGGKVFTITFHGFETVSLVFALANNPRDHDGELQCWEQNLRFRRRVGPFSSTVTTPL